MIYRVYGRDDFDGTTYPLVGDYQTFDAAFAEAMRRESAAKERQPGGMHDRFGVEKVEKQECDLHATEPAGVIHEAKEPRPAPTTHGWDCPCYEFPLEVENIGDDTYRVMSRGHHDLSAFLAAATALYPSWSLGSARHLWFRATPRAGYRCWYSEAAPGSRGAFPVTYAEEAVKP